MTDLPETLVPCFVCEKTLKPIHANHPMQPYGGVICTTMGNFGSAVLDSGIIDQEKVVFLVCDECLTKRARLVRLVVVEHIRPKTTYERWSPYVPV